jgi:6-phosphofructokinase 1
MGAYAARLAVERCFGVTVALSSGRITANSLTEIAGKTKFVSPKHELVQAAKDTGIFFGE